jgi:hypothetical protein
MNPPRCNPGYAKPVPKLPADRRRDSIASRKTSVAHTCGLRLRLGAAIFGAIVPGIAAATEGGGSSLAVGVNTVLAGVMDPPGTYLRTFLTQYDANHTLDGHGNDKAGISDFRITVDAVNFRLSQVWSDVQFWGATIETRIGFTGYVDAQLHFDVQTPNGAIHKAASAYGSGDTLLGPALLGWHSEQYHQIAGIEFFLPSGNFEKTRLVNVGRGYYAIGPAYFFTWLPTNALEVSGNLTYLFNLKNPDTNYLSGNEVALDYGVGYALDDAWQLGASGYVYNQVTDDRQNGQVVGGGNRGKALSIGPFIRYHGGKNWGITFKWQHETLVENKTEGNRYWLQIALKLW